MFGHFGLNFKKALPISTTASKQCPKVTIQTLGTQADACLQKAMTAGSAGNLRQASFSAKASPNLDFYQIHSYPSARVCLVCFVCRCR